MAPRTLILKKAAAADINERSDDSEPGVSVDRDEDDLLEPSLPQRCACSPRISSPPSATSSARVGSGAHAKLPKPGARVEPDGKGHPSTFQRLNFRFGTVEGEAALSLSESEASFGPRCPPATARRRRMLHDAQTIMNSIICTRCS